MVYPTWATLFFVSEGGDSNRDRALIEEENLVKDFNWKEFLKKHPFCWSLKDIEVDKLLQEDTSKERNFPAGTLIVKEGEVGDSVFLIGSGSVQILLFSEDGVEIPLKRLERGEFFGEMAILENRPRAATVKAIEDSTLLEINGRGFLKLLMEHPEIEFKLLLSVSDRLRELNRQVIGANIKQIDEKLKNFNMRLDVELKTVDASLKASQAFFDQTKLRTDEIINSAERSRTRLTVTASGVTTIIALIVAILGWFGYEKFQDFNVDLRVATEAKDAAETAKEQAETAKEQAETAKKGAMNAYRELMTLQYTVEEIKTKVSEYLLKMFDDALKTDDIWDELKYYNYLKDLDPTDVQLMHLLTIKSAILEHGPRKNYANIIFVILNDAKNLNKSDDAISAYLLLLTNASLIGSEKFSNGQTFGQVLSEFERYFNKNTNEQLESEVDLEDLEKLFLQESQDKRGKFQRVKEVVEPPN